MIIDMLVQASSDLETHFVSMERVKEYSQVTPEVSLMFQYLETIRRNKDCIYFREQFFCVCTDDVYLLLTGTMGDRGDEACYWLARTRRGGVPGLQYTLQTRPRSGAQGSHVPRQTRREGERIQANLVGCRVWNVDC